jgi:hypothetical protein
MFFLWYNFVNDHPENNFKLMLTEWLSAADSTKHARVHSRLECLLLHCVPSTFVQHVTPRREHLVDPAIESPLLIPPMVGVFAVSFFFSIHRSSSLPDSYSAAFFD